MIVFTFIQTQAISGLGSAMAACQSLPMISSSLQSGYYISACGSESSLCFYFVFSLRFVSDKEVDHSLTGEHCLSNLTHQVKDSGFITDCRCQERFWFASMNHKTLIASVVPILVKYQLSTNSAISVADPGFPVEGAG